MPRMRLVNATWWLLLLTPALGFFGALITGFTANSPDEALGGLSPDGLLVLLAIFFALVILVRLAWHWRRVDRAQRVEELVVALSVVPLFLAYSGIAAIIGWPHTRSAGVGRYTAALAIAVAWTALVFAGRRHFRRAARSPR